MKHLIVIAAATAAIGFTSSAYAAEEAAQVKSKIEYKKDGGYEASRTSEQTTARGTELSSERNVNVGVDSKGRIDKTVKSESSSDPKGLMNKKKDVSESKIEEKDRGGYKQVTTRKHRDAEGTDTTYKTTTDVDVDARGNVATTATTEKVTDPKGLLNEKTTSSKVKTVNGRVVEEKNKTH